MKKAISVTHNINIGKKARVIFDFQKNITSNNNKSKIEVKYGHLPYNFINVVPIDTLEFFSWKSHCNYIWFDILDYIVKGNNIYLIEVYEMVFQ